LRRSGVLLALCGAAVLGWLGGFAGFVAAASHGTAEEPPTTDAIVVLTGGRHRIERGLELLVEGRAQKLFVSGVHRDVTLHELLRVTPAQPAWVECCVVLGHAAQDTYGNAAESAAWMRRQGYRSMRLVTAAYHMPRSVLELRRAMPEAEIVPNPVFPDGSALLYVIEYHKYLGTLVAPLVRR
jgi:uncharacterized SAM-binding protein YcdF (DUF218 family)